MLKGLVNPFRSALHLESGLEENDGNAEAILLVDPDDDYVRRVTQMLRSLGYPFVFRAHGVNEALDLLKRICPTILLSDSPTGSAERWDELLRASRTLGSSVALVSAETASDTAISGVRMFSKSSLHEESLARLIRDLVAENRAERRESARRVRFGFVVPSQADTRRRIA